jgi:hypothetical protein
MLSAKTERRTQKEQKPKSKVWDDKVGIYATKKK